MFRPAIRVPGDYIASSQMQSLKSDEKIVDSKIKYMKDTFELPCLPSPALPLPSDSDEETKVADR